VHDQGNPRTRTADGLRSWCWLVGTGTALVLGFTATVADDAARWFGIRGPQCPLGACLGERHCPGCGLVRATASALQGDVAAAWRLHPAGLAIAVLLPLAFCVHLQILRRGHVTPAHVRLRRLGRVAFVAAVLLGQATRYFVTS
jgi:hypothetical protein